MSVNPTKENFHEIMNEMLAETNQEQTVKRNKRAAKRKKRQALQIGKARHLIRQLPQNLRHARPPREEINYAKDAKMVKLFVDKLKGNFPRLSNQTICETALLFARETLPWPEGTEHMDICEALGRLYHHFLVTYKIFFLEDQVPRQITEIELDGPEPLS